MNVARDKITVLDGGQSGTPRKPRGGGGGGDSPVPGDWRMGLTRGTTGKVEATAHNLLLILENDAHLDGLFYLDSFANTVALTRDPPWLGGNRDEFTDLDGTELAAWIGSPQRYQLSAKRDLVMDCVEAAARRRARHPVREYLSSLTWDRTPRVERLFVDVFGATDRPYNRQAAQCFFVSAVARILWQDPTVRHNGAQVDFMLTLEGLQGKGKTSAVRALFGAQWYLETTESPSSKDFYQALRGRWGVEIGEMDSFSKADVTKVKQAITSRFDSYRPSYGRTTRSFRRECVFVGTTNENEYLRDATGGRRFLPVRIARVDVPTVLAQRDQLWAEAVHLFREGFRWWDLPPEAVEEQESRYVQDTWEEVLALWLAGEGSSEKEYPERLRMTFPRIDWVTTTELLQWAIGLDVGKHGRPEQMRIGPIMRRLGWEHERTMIGGKRQRKWVREGQGGGDDDVPF